MKVFPSCTTSRSAEFIPQQRPVVRRRQIVLLLCSVRGRKRTEVRAPAWWRPCRAVCIGGSTLQAWTLIETIAVMAVIAILVALVAPTIIRRVDRAAWTQETAELNSIADS